MLVHVPKEHHLYRDMMEVTRVDDAAGDAVVTGEPSFPPGFVKPDPADPSATREQYDMDVIIEVPVKGVAKAGTYTLKFEVRYQGCKKSLCWMPQTDVVESTPTVEEGEEMMSMLIVVFSLGRCRPPNKPSSSGGSPAVDFVRRCSGNSLKATGEPAGPHQVHARLLFDQDKIAPGQTFAWSAP